MTLILRRPEQILRFSIWVFNLVLEPHVQANREPVWNFFFQRVIVAFVCFRIVASVISLHQTRKKSQAGFPVVGWCMIHSVKKSRPKSQYQVLKGAWPIYRSGNMSAGPARIGTAVCMAQLRIGVAQCTLTIWSGRRKACDDRTPMWLEAGTRHRYKYI